MRAGMLFPILPVHFMKWVAAAGDFAMAACGALALYKNSHRFDDTNIERYVELK